MASNHFSHQLNLYKKQRIILSTPDDQSVKYSKCLSNMKQFSDLFLHLYQYIVHYRKSQNKENGKRRKVEENYAAKKVKDMKVIFFFYLLKWFLCSYHVLDLPSSFDYLSGNLVQEFLFYLVQFCFVVRRTFWNIFLHFFYDI